VKLFHILSAAETELQQINVPIERAWRFAKLSSPTAGAQLTELQASGVSKIAHPVPSDRTGRCF
jgi:DNA-binding Lrp family transcriptional regulator